MVKFKSKSTIELDKQLIDMQNAAIALGKCGLSTKQFIETSINIGCIDKMSNPINKLMFGIFAMNNKQILIEDYTRQAIL